MRAPLLGLLRARLVELERSHHRRPELAARRAPARSTGFPALDAALGGGWHVGALNELFLPGDGCGVLEAFLPALSRARLLAWVHPTRTPYPPALAQAGFELPRLLLVRPRDAREQAWAIDLALRSGACDVVVTWIGALDDTALRRLQLAAEQGGALGLFLRPTACAHAPSPAAVRLDIAPLPSCDTRRRLRIALLRCRGAAPLGGESLILEWPRDPLDEPATAELRARTPPARFAAACRALGA